MVISLCTGVFLYGYFVQATIYSIIERKALIQEMEYRVAQVSTFEHTYSLLQNTITREFAYSDGFEDTREKTYALRKRFARGE